MSVNDCVVHFNLSFCDFRVCNEWGNSKGQRIHVRDCIKLHGNRGVPPAFNLRTFQSEKSTSSSLKIEFMQEESYDSLMGAKYNHLTRFLYKH